MKGEQELVRVSNQLYIGCMEYHLTMAAQAETIVSPQVPLEVSETFRCLEKYLPEGVDVHTGDFREVERARTLCLFCWILRADTQADKAPEEPFDPLSTKKEDFPLGTVLHLLLAPQVTTISYEEVVINVLHENVADLKLRAEELEDKLEGCRDVRNGTLMKVKKLEAARDAAQGSGSPQALATAEDVLIKAQARLQCDETAIKRQLKYVKQAWEAYNLGCDRIRPGPQKASSEGPSQDPENQSQWRRMKRLWRRTQRCSLCLRSPKRLRRLLSHRMTTGYSTGMRSNRPRPPCQRSYPASTSIPPPGQRWRLKTRRCHQCAHTLTQHLGGRMQLLPLSSI
ncbi:MAG: hypothetical protein MJE68_17155, partial [Proteobacteria bacterium]|nr:hypothetical protein [Pseudomonadota bacterium]